MSKLTSSMWSYQLQVRVYEGPTGARTSWRTVRDGCWSGSDAGKELSMAAFVAVAEVWERSHMLRENVRLLVQPEFEETQK